METWSLPKARPISCNDCPAFQRLHMSVRWFAASFTRLTCVMNTTFREKIYSRWCCIDRLSRQGLSECGPIRFRRKIQPSDKTSCAVGAPPGTKRGSASNRVVNRLFLVGVEAIFRAEDVSRLGLH